MPLVLSLAVIMTPVTLGHRMFAQVLFVDSQYVRRRSDICFQVIVKSISVIVANIASFADAEDDRLEKVPRTCIGLVSIKFQGPTAALAASSNVSLPMPCAPRKTSAWLIFSHGRCTRWASQGMICFSA